MGDFAGRHSRVVSRTPTPQQALQTECAGENYAAGLRSVFSRLSR